MEVLATKPQSFPSIDTYARIDMKNKGEEEAVEHLIVWHELDSSGLEQYIEHSTPEVLGESIRQALVEAFRAGQKYTPGA